MNVAEKVKYYLKQSDKYVLDYPKLSISYSLLAQSTVNFYLKKEQLSNIEIEE